MLSFWADVKAHLDRCTRKCTFIFGKFSHALSKIYSNHLNTLYETRKRCCQSSSCTTILPLLYTRLNARRKFIAISGDYENFIITDLIFRKTFPFWSMRVRFRFYTILMNIQLFHSQMKTFHVLSFCASRLVEN